MRTSSPRQRYIAFLRAINVGGHTVKMDHLRALFSAMRLTNVETFIASGNVLFDGPPDDVTALEQKIEATLEQALGYPVATFLRTPSELAAIAAYEPFPSLADDAVKPSLYVGFLKGTPPASAHEQLGRFCTPVDELHIHGREAYWRCRVRSGDSEFSGARLEKTLGAATMRNITTVRKLALKVAR